MSFPRYPAYKDSGVKWMGEVPEHWEVDRLKYIAKASPSNVDKKSYEGDHAVLLCNYTDVYYNEEIVAGMSFMAATATTDQVEKFTLRAGDTIITKDSETADDIAISAYVPQNLPGVVCGYHLSLIRPREGADGRFIKRLFDSHFARATLGIAANGLTRYGLSQYPLDNFELPLPPAGEQTAIATFLDRETAKIDALVADYRTLIDLLQEKRQAVISHAVTKGLDPTVTLKDSGVECLGEVPEHWLVGNIRHFAWMRTGHTPSRSKPEYWEDCEIPWFTLADVWQLRDGHRKYFGETAAKISQLGLNNSAAELLPAGTVCFSRTASVGFSGIMPKPMATSQDFWNWIPKSGLNSDYLLYLFRTMRPEFNRLTMGSTHKTIYQADAAGLHVCVPTQKEQANISAYLDRAISSIDALVDDAEDAITLLQERRTALISAAVTGKIDVRSRLPIDVALQAYTSEGLDMLFDQILEEEQSKTPEERKQEHEALMSKFTAEQRRSLEDVEAGLRAIFGERET